MGDGFHFRKEEEEERHAPNKAPAEEQRELRATNHFFISHVVYMPAMLRKGGRGRVGMVRVAKAESGQFPVLELLTFRC